MLAVSSDGDRYFQFLRGTNNEASVSAFFFELASYLDITKPDWRDSHVLLLDNCSSHKTKITRTVLRNLGFKVMFSAPASFLSAPVEMLFGAVKRKDKRQSYKSVAMSQ